jgi:hypothetical protein
VVELETSSAVSTSVRIAEDRIHLLDDGAAQCVVSMADKGSVQQFPGPRSNLSVLNNVSGLYT